MTTATIPTTITPGALELARRLHVEHELEAILERGRQSVRGLRCLEVVGDTAFEMDEAITIRAWVDPTSEDDPSHQAWWDWRIEQFGPIRGGDFVVAIHADRTGHAG